MFQCLQGRNKMIITTIAEQKRVGRVARAVGGYSNLVKLAGEREHLLYKYPGKEIELYKNDSGEYHYRLKNDIEQTNKNR